MGRKPKLYVPLTVTFFEDDRIISVGDGPTLLYLAMLLHCKACGSDGRITETQVARLHRPRWKVELRRLAEVGLVVFDDTEQDWFIAGWLNHNDSMAAIYQRRADDRDRKNSGRNPDGFHSDSALKGSKERERKGGNPRGTHRFVDDGDGACAQCSLPSVNGVHLRVVAGEAS